MDRFVFEICRPDGKMKKEYTNDGLHLLGAGYIVWRDAVIGYVNE